jgi:hypothetical protein
MPAKKAKFPPSIYQLKITLQEIRPPILRLIQVPSTLLLCCLHDVLQAVMGWTDSHLHQFEKDGKYWGVPEHYEEDDIDVIDESRVAIGKVLRTEGDSILHLYDFGDDWRHDIMLENILPAPGAAFRPVCIAGARHCPPEDVGGVSGYEEFLEVVFDPAHKEHEHMISWAGGRFQPEEFSAMAVNDALSRIRFPARHR